MANLGYELAQCTGSWPSAGSFTGSAGRRRGKHLRVHAVPVDRPLVVGKMYLARDMYRLENSPPLRVRVANCRESYK